MVTELRIYFEGDKLLKPGFHKFLNEIVNVARAQRCRLQLVATEGTPVDDYRDALKAHPNAWNVLLLDSDARIDSPLEQLCRRKGIEPSNSGSVFWMVQIMESWFLADTHVLTSYFGESIREGNANVEEIPKIDVLQRLDRAAHRKFDRRYHKITDGVKLLETTNATRVRKAAPNCERMFTSILKELTS
jgi:hypothetical protein